MSDYDAGNVPGYIAKLPDVCEADIDGIKAKDRSYGASWKKRGGTGAFMMLARKWDRLEEQVRCQGWDVFKAVIMDNSNEGVLDTIRDLRRYLLLVEADLLARDVVPGAGTAAHPGFAEIAKENSAALEAALRGVHQQELNSAVTPRVLYRTPEYTSDEHGVAAPGLTTAPKHMQPVQGRPGVYVPVEDPPEAGKSCEWRTTPTPDKW